MLVAITRGVSSGLQRCELTHLPRRRIDLALAEAQHAAYEACLAELGCTVQRLPADAALPDCVFVEDTAVVLDELAVIARPGAATRRPEVEAVQEALRRYRPLHLIEPPATLDGGDVLLVGRTLYVGLTQRTNAAAVEQLQELLAPYGYTVKGVPVDGCLHLKSAVTRVAPDTLLINRDWVDAAAFGPLQPLDVDPSEAYAANALLVGEAVIHASAYPRTRRRLEAHGIAVRPVDISELAKAEGAATCCSLILAV